MNLKNPNSNKKKVADNNNTCITSYAHEQQQHKQVEERRHHQCHSQQLDNTNKELVFENKMLNRKKPIVCRCCLLEEDNSMTKYLPLDTEAAFITDPKQCYKDDDSVSSQKTPTLLDCLNMCAHIGAQLYDTKLPQYICLDCCQALESCCEFIRCVQNADKILKVKLQKKLNDEKCTENAGEIVARTIKNDLTTSPEQKGICWSTEIVTVVESIELKMENQQSVKKNLNKHQEQHKLKDDVNNNIDEYIKNVDVIDSDVTDNAEAGAANCNEMNAGVDDDIIYSTQQSEMESDIITHDSEVDDDNHEIVSAVEHLQTKTIKEVVPAECDECDTEADSHIVRSFDSGIEIDDDHYNILSEPQNSECDELNQYMQTETDDNTNQLYHIEDYDHNSFVVERAIAERLQFFHNQNGQCNNNEHSIRLIKCGFCVYQCPSAELLEKHMEIHLGPARYNCNMCTYRCRFRYFLRKHKRLKHDVCDSLYIDLNPVIDQNTLERTTTYSMIFTKYQCGICKNYLMTLEALQQHIEMHKVEIYECTLCPFNDLIKENILEHLSAEHGVLVDLKVVDHYIPLKNPLESIYAAKTETAGDIKPNSPSINSLSRSIISLSRLSKIKKLGKHLCQFCGKCFDRSFHLLKHEYNVHKINFGTESLKYKFSKKSTPKLTQLQYHRHRKSVQVDRRIQCYQCGKVFKTTTLLMQHRQYEHGDTIKFECDICGEHFMFNFELKYHRRTHELKNNGAELTKSMKSSQKRKMNYNRHGAIPIRGKLLKKSSCDTSSYSTTFSSAPSSPAASFSSFGSTVSQPSSPSNCTSSISHGNNFQSESVPHALQSSSLSASAVSAIDGAIVHAITSAASMSTSSNLLNQSLPISLNLPSSTSTDSTTSCTLDSSPTIVVVAVATATSNRSNSNCASVTENCLQLSEQMFQMHPHLKSPHFGQTIVLAPKESTNGKCNPQSQNAMNKQSTNTSQPIISYSAATNHDIAESPASPPPPLSMETEHGISPLNDDLSSISSPSQNQVQKVSSLLPIESSNTSGAAAPINMGYEFLDDGQFYLNDFDLDLLVC